MCLLLCPSQCICGVYRAHILQSEKEIPEPSEKFAVFNDVQPSPKPSSSGTGKEETRTPSLEQITTFYRDVFRRSQMEADCIIMSLVYVERLIRRTDGQLRPRNNNWRSLLFSCMILASKVWDDMSMWVSDTDAGSEFGKLGSMYRVSCFLYPPPILYFIHIYHRMPTLARLVLRVYDSPCNASTSWKSRFSRRYPTMSKFQPPNMLNIIFFCGPW